MKVERIFTKPETRLEYLVFGFINTVRNFEKDPEMKPPVHNGRQITSLPCALKCFMNG